MDSPIFSKDMPGVLTLLGWLLTQLTVIVIAVWRVSKWVNGLGGRVDTHETRLTKVETEMEGVHALILKMNSDILEAVRASSTAHTDALHKVDLNVAGLSADVRNLQRERDT